MQIEIKDNHNVSFTVLMFGELFIKNGIMYIKVKGNSVWNAFEIGSGADFYFISGDMVQRVTKITVEV